MSSLSFDSRIAVLAAAGQPVGAVAAWRILDGPGEVAQVEGRAVVRLPWIEPLERRLAARVEVPAALAGGDVVVRFGVEEDRPGSEHPRPAAAEALVRVDGVPWQALDLNHLELRLEPGPHELELRLWMGREGGERRLSAEVLELPAGLDRLLAEARVARDLAEGAGDARLRAALQAALDDALPALRISSDSSDFDFAAAGDRLAARRRALAAEHPPSDRVVHLVGNSHLDVAWLWTTDETREKMARTTATMLRMMEELPDFRFLQTQPQLYAWLEEDHPDLFEAVRARVAEERWEIMGAMWVEPDCNIPSGESLVRQILHGQAYWRSRFGRESDVLWLPDTFGYAWALPQIMAKSGLTHFVTQKLTWNDTNPFPHGHFEWQGVDGTRVRCTLPQTLVARALPADIARAWRGYPSADVVPSLLFPFGYGDGGGGPVREDVLAARALADAPAPWTCRLSPAARALAEIRSDADARAEESGRPVPVWTGELYLEMHRGTLTTHARMKALNRRAEAALRDAELWSARAAIDAGAPWPGEALCAAWERVLLNQFHDIVPGSSIPEVYPDATRRYLEAIDSAEACAARALERLAGGVAGRGKAGAQAKADTDAGAASSAAAPSRAPTGGGASAWAFTLASTHPWGSTEWVELSVPVDGAFHVVDADGAVVPHQLLEEDDDGRRIGLEARLPALGAAAFRVRAGAGPAPPPLSASEGTLESARFRLALDARGRLASLHDGALGRQWLAGPGNGLQTFADEPSRWEAWEIEPGYEDAPLDAFRFEGAEVRETGPLRAVLRLRHGSDAGSVIEQDVVLYRTIPRVDFLTRVDWRERRTLLKAAFPLAVRTEEATYEIQFGAIARSTRRDTSWEAARFEVCGHRWADLSDAGGGVSLLNDGRYGHDARGSTLRLSLLRNAIAPDPREPMRAGPPPDGRHPRFTDTGEHHLRYALFPHAGDWRSGTVAQALSFNAPPRVLPGLAAPLEGWRVHPAGVVVETVKAAEDGAGWALRVWEAHGYPTEARVVLPFPPREARAADLMERPCREETPTLSGRELRFRLRPFEVRTFRLLV
ncbi:MAG TPA: glycoside hydrolase family 38 C-terminal domain-containing protein [Longimicrobiales bacterium]|nr:glycoside hydrolase family 38 C-terminal domain-containing protein [Longimicrobiales bacterium]